MMTTPTSPTTPTTPTTPITWQQLARIRANFDGTSVSLRLLASELGLPFYTVREAALALGLPNAQQPPRKRHVVRRSYHANPTAALEVAS